MGLNLIAAAAGSTAAPLGVTFSTRALSQSLSAQVRLQQQGSSPGGTIPFLRRSASEVGVLGVQSQRLATQVARFDAASAAFETSADLVTELTSLATQAISADSATRTTLNAAAQNIITTIIEDISAQRSLLSEYVIPVALPGGTTASNATIGSVAISSSNRVIDSGGLNVQVDVLGADTGTARRAGNRAVRGNAVNNGGTGVTNATTEFIVAGNRGSANFLYAAGVSLDDIVEDINAETINTGVEAFRDAAGHIDLYAVDYGSDSIVTVTELQNTGQLAGGTDVGQNARATFTLGSGESITVEAEGRYFEFSLGGFDFEIDFITGNNGTTGAALLTEGAGADFTRNFTIFEGGAAIDPTSTTGEKLALPELQASRLGYRLGGLTSIDLENDPDGALEILDLVGTDINSGRTKIENALSTLVNRLDGVTAAATVLQIGIQNFETLSDLRSSFGVLRNQAAADSSTVLVSQVAQLYPSVLNLFLTNR